MEFIKSIIDFVLHIDAHLVEIVNDYQTWTYLILFLIIFAETGLVVTPILPVALRGGSYPCKAGN